jgi:C4-dicarboxylate transporter, DctM subunit
VEVAAIGFVAVFALLFLGAPIAFGMALVGFGGFGLLVGWHPALAMLGQIAYETTLSDSLSVLPLFILMGNLITRAGLSRALFDCAYAFLGARRGGLAMATVVACGGFAAVSGSSMATSATMAKVAIPSMRRFGYADSLAAGSIAAGGTLGILIPPSVILVLYGILTSTSIGDLFIAGVIPGIVGVLFYMGAVAVTTALRPEAGPPGERSGWAHRLATLRDIWGVLVLFALVMGGIYFGVFTPTEAAGIGAGGSLLFALYRRGLTWKRLLAVLVETTLTSTMMFTLLIGAVLFSNFINVAGLPRDLSAWIGQSDASPVAIMALILAVYIGLGCLLESLSMLLLTIPIFFPIIVTLGFDPVWFGIIVVVVIEISLITPPIGLNVFVLNATLPDIAIGTIFRGVAPFIAADILRLALLVSVPGITLFLPSLMR